jgi:SOS-response transcriptional repressor LexA
VCAAQNVVNLRSFSPGPVATQRSAVAGSALALRERLPDPGNRAISHNNLSAYLHATGAPAEAGSHQLAALAYRLTTGLDPRLSLHNLAVRLRQAAARNARFDLPRLADLLADPAFAPLRTYLEGRGIPPADLQTAIDALVEQVRASATADPVPTSPETSTPEAYKTMLPLYTLKAAAGYFGNGEAVEAETWVDAASIGKLDEKMFVVRAKGKSMEPHIHDGDYLVFRADPAGSRQGKIVLAQYQGPSDPETGGAYTVKLYKSEKRPDPEGEWRHAQIVLSPLNPDYQPIVITEDKAEGFRILAELVGVLGDDARGTPSKSGVAPGSTVAKGPLLPDAAIERLTRAGLVCRQASGRRLHIQGGTSISSCSGIDLYQKAFTILGEQGGGFRAMVAGTRPFYDEETQVNTLEEAVDAVLRIYGARGTLPGAEARR